MNASTKRGFVSSSVTESGGISSIPGQKRERS
jgi:hypothetical protein